MPTNDKKVNIYYKRLMSRTAFKDDFLDFLVGTIDDVAGTLFQGRSGTMDADDIIIEQNPGDPDEFQLDLTDASRVLVGGGQIIDLSQITGASITEEIPYPNVASTVYYVGIIFAEIPIEVEYNPRTGDPEYPRLKQTYGELDNPTSVTDNTTYIRININSITESGVDHSGRTIRVWLDDPVSGDDSVCYFEGISAYSSPNNYVDIPYSGSNGPLGQDTGVDPPSTTASDYWVFEEGVTWKQNTNLSTLPAYAFLGTITGGSPPTFDMSGQPNLYLITLDTAYDGPIGSGSGRVATIDSGAVEFNSPSGTGDEHGAALRINQKGSATVGITAESIIATDGGGLCDFFVETNATGSLTTNNAANTTSTTVVTATTANFQTAGILNAVHLCWIHGSANSDGLYGIQTVSGSALTLTGLGGGAPGLTASESCSVTILTPNIVSTIGSGIGYGSSNLNGGVLEAAATNSAAAQKVSCHTIHTGIGYTDALRVYRGLASGAANLRLIIDDDGELIEKTGVHLDLQVGLTPVASGLKIDMDNCGLFPATGEYGGEIKDGLGAVVEKIDTQGRRCNSHVFEDDFQYKAGSFTSASTPYWTVSTSGGGLAESNRIAGSVSKQCTGGILALRTTASGNVTVLGPETWAVDTNYTKLRYACRFFISSDDIGTKNIKFGLQSTTGPMQMTFLYDYGTFTDYALHYRTIDSSSNYDTGVLISSGSVEDDWHTVYITVVTNTAVYFSAGGSGTSTSTMITSMAGSNYVWQPVFYHNNSGTDAITRFDYIKVWDQTALAFNDGANID